MAGEAAAPIVPNPAAPLAIGGAAPAAPAAPDPKAERFAEVTRLQTQTVQQGRQITQLTQKLEALSKAGVDMEALKAQGRTNPLAVLNTLGLKFKDVAEYVINSKDGEPDPIKTELAELKKWREDQEKQQETAAQQREREKLNGDIAAAKSNIQGIIDKDTTVELLKVYQSAAGETGADLAWNIMLEHWNRNGTALDPAAAVEAAENWLTDYGERFASTSKVQSRLATKREADEKAKLEAEAAAKASGKGVKPKPADAKKPGPTLTNSTASAAPAAGGSDDDHPVPHTRAWNKKLENITKKYSVTE